MTAHVPEFTDALTAAPVLGIVRAGSVASAVARVRALAQGGLRAIEISLSSQDALTAFGEAHRVLPPSALLGIGTVRTAADADSAIAAGAAFLVTPNHSPAVVARARDAGIPIVCGVLTPTEIQVAVDAGIEWLKIFPAGSFGPAYLRALRAPFPEVRFVPTGGIAIEDVPSYRQAGASAVGLAGALSASSDDGAASAARTALQGWGSAHDG
jgi:2-dehydro-3-deoxyphosphogluconate aldolase/(4S)-4-hydroxy-2-oxoglutarate aldolase